MSEASVKTINDIARLAGVSKSTVSRALSDSPLISAKTKASIRAIAEANNFAIHQGARNLSMQRTNTIAVVIPIDPAIGRFVTDPFNLELLGAIANAIADYNYDLLVAQVRYNDPKPIDRHLTSKRVDGLILFACDVESDDLVRLTMAQAPFIVWGPAAPKGDYCTVGSDDVHGGYLATQHLLQQGRRNIAYISGPPGASESNLRQQGYEQALREAGLFPAPVPIEYGRHTFQSGYQSMKTMLSHGQDIDAVFVCSDQMALGAIQALHEKGMAVPQDIAIIGFDGSPVTAHSNPPLSTIRQDMVAAGRLLVENLLRYIDDGQPTQAVLPVELIVRQSTIG